MTTIQIIEEVVEATVAETTITATIVPTTISVSLVSGVTDHGALTGLADDDHTQYHNDARGDARYWRLTTDLATQVELDAEISTRSAADTALSSAIASETASRISGDNTNAAALTTHAALTTSAHGGIVPSNRSLTIAGTAFDLSADRNWSITYSSLTGIPSTFTPSAHASTHISAGTDPLTLSESQITNLVSDLAAKQTLDATLTALAGVTTAANKLIYATGVDAFATTDLTAAARSVLDDTTVGAILTTIGGVPTTRTLTINSVVFDLSADRSWTISVSPFIATNDANVPLITRGFSPTQSGDLFQLQDNTTGILTRFDKNGILFISDYLTIGENVQVGFYNATREFQLSKTLTSISQSVNGGIVDAFDFYLGIDVPSSVNPNSIYALNFGVDVIGANSNIDYLGGINGYAYHESNIDAVYVFGATIYVNSFGGGDIATSDGIFADVANYGSGVMADAAAIRIAPDTSEAAVTIKYGMYIGSQVNAGIVTNPYPIWTDGGYVRHKAGAATIVPLSLQRAASQTGDTFQILDSDGITILHRYNKGAYWITNRNSAPADGDLSANDCALWFDSQNTTPAFKIKAKKANGTVVSGTVLLT